MDDLATAITKAIGYTEQGGKPDISRLQKGASGEMKSVFQYMPNTWKQYAGEILGDPNAPMTPDSESFVTQKKVEGMLAKGMKPEQIFSVWNAGAGEPDAYTGKFSDGSPSGNRTNPKGVKFDVPKYVNKAMGYLKQFQTPVPSPQMGMQTSSPSSAKQDESAADMISRFISTVQGKSVYNAPTKTPPAAGGLIGGLLTPKI